MRKRHYKRHRVKHYKKHYKKRRIKKFKHRKVYKNQLWRRTKAWRIAKRKAIKRDGGKCVICGSNKHLQVHHKNDASFHPEQVFKLNNLVTLCAKCHRNFHTNFKKSFKEKCTVYDWKNFVVLTNYFKTKFCKNKCKK